MKKWVLLEWVFAISFIVFLFNFLFEVLSGSYSLFIGFLPSVSMIIIDGGLVLLFWFLMKIAREKAK